MLVFLITGAIAGILLGLRFKVLVLVPAFLVAMVVIILNGSGRTLGTIVLTVLGTLVSLQIGLLLARFFVPSPARTCRQRSAINASDLLSGASLKIRELEQLVLSGASGKPSLRSTKWAVCCEDRIS